MHRSQQFEILAKLVEPEPLMRRALAINEQARYAGASTPRDKCAVYGALLWDGR